MQKTITAVVLLIAAAIAYEPPSWVNLGNLDWGKLVYDIVEIPSNGWLLACGQRDYGNQHQCIWRSTDRGVSWSHVLTSTHDNTQFMQMQFDGFSRVWAVGWYGGAEALAYSADNGGTWTFVTGPPSSPTYNGCALQVVGNYLYFGGVVASPYSIALYRLNVVNMQWEMVVQYPQCNAIARLKYYNGRLLVFCRDMTTSAIRVFSYTPSDLDAKAVPVGFAETRPAAAVQD